MKRIGYIYEKLCDKTLIREAIIKASRKKRHRKSVRRILNDIDRYVDEIHIMMLNEEFTPSPYRRFHIKDGATQKEREICCPKFYPDQIIHWMLIMAIQPILQRGMYEFNCGSVPGRGAHYGKRYLERWYKRDRKNTKYCAKLDVRKFYPSAKSPVIMRELRRVIKCKRTLRLCEVILNSADGLPIGNYTSQWFANFLLQRLDHYIKEVLRIPHYVRYMDDMCLLSASKRALHRAVTAIREFLAGLSLQLKDNWQVFPTASRAVDFLGFRFFREKTTLRKNLSLRMRRRVKKIHCYTAKHGGKARPRDAAAVMSYAGWLNGTATNGFYEKYIRPYINFKKLKEAIRHETRVRARTAYCIGGSAQPCGV